MIFDENVSETGMPSSSLVSAKALGSVKPAWIGEQVMISMLVIARHDFCQLSCHYAVGCQPKYCHRS